MLSCFYVLSWQRYLPPNWLRCDRGIRWPLELRESSLSLWHSLSCPRLSVSSWSQDFFPWPEPFGGLPVGWAEETYRSGSGILASHCLLPCCSYLCSSGAKITKRAALFGQRLASLASAALSHSRRGNGTT